MEEAPKKYYWLKLQKDFFKRHDIRIIESMPNGKDYIIFYLKLLTESISHDGQLRFSEVIPYETSMLAVITNTNVDIVKTAISVFQNLKLMEIWDDQTIYMTETTKMLGTETTWAREKREYRQKIGQAKDNVRTKKDNVRQEIELDKELDKDKDKEEYKEKEIGKEKESAKSKRFAKPTIEDIENYIIQNNYDTDPNSFANRFYNFYESKGWVIGKASMKNWKAAIRTWITKDKIQIKKVVVPETDYVESISDEDVAKTLLDLDNISSIKRH